MVYRGFAGLRICWRLVLAVVSGRWLFRCLVVCDVNSVVYSLFFSVFSLVCDSLISWCLFSC